MNLQIQIISYLRLFSNTPQGAQASAMVYTMVEMARREIAPAVEAYIKELAKTAALKKSVSDEVSVVYENTLIKELSVLTERIFLTAGDLENTLLTVEQHDNVIDESAVIRDTLLVKMNELRVPCDEAETLTAKKYWPFPTYGDLLFGVR